MIYSDNFSLGGRKSLKTYLQNCEKSRDFTLDSSSKDSKEDTCTLNSRAIEDSEFNNQSLTAFLSSESMRINSTDSNAMEVDQALSTTYVQVPHERVVLRKILSYMFLLSKYVCTKLNINLKYCLTIEKLIKELILNSDNFDLLNNKHLDQVVLCSIITILFNEKVISADELISKVTLR